MIREYRGASFDVGVEAVVVMTAGTGGGLVPRLCGSAVYGPVRTVVWDPWLAL